MSENNNNITDIRLNEIEKTLIEMRNDIGKIYNAVIGNQELDQMGLIGRIKKLEETNESTQRFKNRVIGFASGAGVLSAILFELVKKLF
jgi:tetrahydromethanopterin S-methyltransferase subunit F